jgi:hypothetical protein
MADWVKPTKKIMANIFRAKSLISRTGVFSNEVLSPNLIYNTGDQTIYGVKDFDSLPTVNSSGIALQNAGIIKKDTFESFEVDGNYGDGNLHGFFVAKTTNRSDANIGLYTYQDDQTTLYGSALIGIRNGDAFLQSKSNNVRVETVGGNLAILNASGASFDSRPTVNGTGVLLSGEAASLPTTIVYTTGDQTISGIKTFDIAPVVSGNSLITGNLSLYATTVNLESTGSTLNNNIQSLSGTLTSTYATISNLASTGSTLISSINSLNDSFTGFTGNLDATYATDTQLFNTGSALDIKINSLSGSLNSSGINLNNRINLLSGASVLTYGNQNITGNKTFINNIEVQGTGIFNALDLSNISDFSFSGVTINLIDSTVQSSGQIYISGNPVSTGTVILPNTIVYTTGDQTISGIKDFSDQVKTFGDLDLNYTPFTNKNIRIWTTGYSAGAPIPVVGVLIDTSGIDVKNGMVLKVSGVEVTPSLYASINNLASTGLNLSNSIDSLSGLFTGYTGNLDATFATDAQLQNTGSTLSQNINSLSGTLTNDYYLKSNPSGFITGVDLSSYLTSSTASSTYATITNLANTGSTLDNKINSLSGVTVLTYSNQNISGTKNFIDNVNFSGTGTFNAIDLNNIDNLSLSGVDVTLTDSIINVNRNIFISGNPVLTGVNLTPYATTVNLALTGLNLSNNISSLSGLFTGYTGNLDSTFASDTQLFNTGSTLDAKINTLSGSSVLLYDNQTINGLKDFTTRPTVNTTPVLLSGENAAGLSLLVKNDESFTLYKGQPVYINSANGANILIKLAGNTGEDTSSKTLGLLSENLAPNAQGYVITEGQLEGIDTDAGNAGDPVWLGPTGNLIFGTANKPYGANHLVYLGVVERKQANNGKIYVKVQNGFELEELHNVDINHRYSLNNDDVLRYDSASGIWYNRPISTGIFQTQISSLSGTLTSDYVTKSNGLFTNTPTVNGTNILLSGEAITSGDLTGNLPYPTINKLQGYKIDLSATPAPGQVLEWNGTSWAAGTIPLGGGGGGGRFYYFNFLNTTGIAPSGGLPTTGDFALSLLGRSYAIGSGLALSADLEPQGGEHLICGFVSASGDPGITNIPAGLWDFNIWASVNSANATQSSILAKVHIYNPNDSTYRLLGTSDDVYLYDTETIAQYILNVTVPQTGILSTERIYVEIYGKKYTSAGRQITMYFDSYRPSHVHTTIPSVAGNGVVKVIDGVFQTPATGIFDNDVDNNANIAQSKIANLSSDLTTIRNTGTALDLKIGALSGTLTSTYATITNLANTGSTLQTNIDNLSNTYATITNVGLTGITLNNNITSLSGLFTGFTGNLDTSYATDLQLLNTGITLNTRINNLSGYINSTSSNIVFTTGNQTISGVKTFIQDATFGDTGQGDFLVISGNNFTVYGSGNFTSGLFVNGNAVLTGVDLTPYATTVNLALTGNTLTNNITSLSGLFTGYTGTLDNTYATDIQLFNTGSTLQTNINNLSGYVNSTGSNILFTTGNQTINGNKSFTSSSVLTVKTISGFQGSSPESLNLVATNDNTVVSNVNLAGNINLTAGTGTTFGASTYGNINLNAGGPKYDGTINLNGNINLNSTNNTLLSSRSIFIYKTGLAFGSPTAINALTIDNNNISLNTPVGGAAGFGLLISGVLVTPALYATSANLASTGSTLQTNINNLSSTYATITNVGLTGSTLTNNITSLSGLFTGYTGTLDATYATDLQLLNTGITLNTRINNLSGVSVLTYGNQNIGGNKTFTGVTTFSGQEVNIIDTALNLSGLGDMTFSGTNINFINSPVFISGTNLRVAGDVLGNNLV